MTIESLLRDLEEARRALAQKDSVIAHKDEVIAGLQRLLFGRRSEKNVLAEPAPLHGQLDAFAPEEEELPTVDEMKEEASEPTRPRHRKPAPRRPLPADLPRMDVQIDIPPAERACPCCGRDRVCIGQDVSEKLELVPQRLHVRRTIRPRYACGSCKEGVIQAPLPPSPLPRADASASLLAWLLISKYEDHAPLCRQERLFARLGIDMPRRRTSEWMMALADLLAPLAALMRRRVVQSSAVIGADETPINVLNAAGKSIAQGWLWVYRGDDGAPYTIFDYGESRGGDNPRAMLAGYAGWLVSDGYGVYQSIKTDGKLAFQPAACWAHARRKFVEALKAGDKRAEPLIELIGRLYKVEQEAGELSADERQQRRARESLPVLGEIRRRLEDSLDVLPRSGLGRAIGYTLDLWDRLTVYTTDGRLPIDNNAVERSIRPAALGRKNWLFAGSPRGGRAAGIFLTLIDSARRAGLNTWDYFLDVISRIGDHPANRLEELLPNNWQPAKPTN